VVTSAGASAWDFTCLLPVCATDDSDHFHEAMESIAKATLAPTHILICEDGPLPADLERAVASRAQTLGARRMLNPGPRGLHHNLNQAMAAVRTPWICRADADDVNLPLRFETQVRFLAAHPDVDAVGSDIVEFWPDGRERRKAMAASHAQIVRRARWRNPINHMTAFARTDAILACGGYPDIAMKEDYGLWLRMIARGYRLANLEDVLVRARLGPDFYRRRSGLAHIASEYALFRLKGDTPGIGGAAAALAFVARAGVLATGTTARAVYETALRR